MTLRRDPILFTAFFLISTAWAQETNTRSLTIQEAVERSQKFPSIEASEEQVDAAAAGIRIAGTNYLPSVNALGQVNRATRNNVFGLLLPQNVISNMSGPVLGTNTGSTVCGSAVGVLVSWEPFDFGRRRALMESAQATQQRAELTSKRTQFDVQTATAAAAQMVGSLGMAGSLISYDAIEGAGGANLVAKVISSKEGKKAVEDILENAKKQVTAMLNENRHLIESLRDALLIRDELLGEEIMQVIATAQDASVDVRRSRIK